MSTVNCVGTSIDNYASQISGINQEKINNSDMSYTVKSEPIEDSIVSNGKFEEDLELKVKNKGLFKTQKCMTGIVNDKVVYLKESKSNGYKTYTGSICNEEGCISIKKDKITGRIGDKDIDLVFNPGNKFNISGTIGDKEINISKGSSIDEAKGENDILTTVASLKGSKFKLKNGNFVNLKPSEQKKKDKENIISTIFDIFSEVCIDI